MARIGTALATHQAVNCQWRHAASVLPSNTNEGCMKDTSKAGFDLFTCHATSPCTPSSANNRESLTSTQSTKPRSQHYVGAREVGQAGHVRVRIGLACSLPRRLDMVLGCVSPPRANEMLEFGSTALGCTTVVLPKVPIAKHAAGCSWEALMPGLPVRLLRLEASATMAARWPRALRRAVICRMGPGRGCSGWPPFLTAPLLFSLAAAVAENTLSRRGRACAVMLRLSSITKPTTIY